MRAIVFEESRNEQELTQHEEDLEAVLTDGAPNTFALKVILYKFYLKNTYRHNLTWIY